jgi:methionine-S-sulfoxide reductase
VRTRVGYAGGTTKNPSYRAISDYSETLQVDYDPTVTSYEKLLQVFWKCHNPCAQAGTRQYMTAVFYRDEKQKRLAEETRAHEAARRGQKIVTAILPLGPFYLAEDYHQKYYLRQHAALLREFETIYPRKADFMASTAVARVNAYVAGRGTSAGLEREIAGLGLSDTGRKRLQDIVRHGR